MHSKRASYLPIASIVVAIIILAAVVGLISFRDIDRGRRQVDDVLDRQARLAVASVGAIVRSSLLAPQGVPSRLPDVFAEAAADEEVSHLAILDRDGKIIVHSSPDEVGRFWTGGSLPEPRPPGRGLNRRILLDEGRTIHEYVAALPLRPRHPRGPGGRRIPHRLRDFELPLDRLSEFLGRDITSPEDVQLFVVVGLDSTDLYDAFLASRQHTLLLSAVLLLVGGAAIYFLFLISHYRSVRSALANMRSYTTNVIESMGSGLVSIDADARVVTINSRARSLLGLPSGDVSGRALNQVLRFESDADAAAVQAVLNGTSDSLESEVAISTPDASIPVALAASSLRDEDGARSGTVLLFQDLREIEALKAEVEREKHLASLGRLAAGVAHEVRNPLSSLKGFAQFLRSRFTPGSREERYADIMIEEVERLDRVVQELLDFAKPVTPDRKPSGANEIVDEALALVSDDASFRRVEIVTKLGENLPAVFVDPLQIRQVLLNVLLNGFEAMPEGGTLTIETRAGVGDDADSTVTVTVTDTGQGMSEDEVGKLYEPFYTTKQQGTGLGLTIVARVLEQNGGSISASSVPGSGSAFVLRLPTAGGATSA